MNLLQQYVHIFRWLPKYGRADFWGDLAAGATVGVMLIPQGMAYAILAGLPPVYGLYASLVPLVVYPIFGTSQHLAVGIMAIDMLIVAAGLSLVADAGTERYVQLAFLLAVMVGTLQLAMGLARLGFIVNLLSRPVISGFTAAAAITIGVSQFKNVLGIPLDSFEVFGVLWEVAGRLGEIHAYTLLIAVVGMLALLALRLWTPLAPGPLIAVVFGTLAVWYFQLDRSGVQIVGNIPTGLPTLVWPLADMSSFRALVPTAITLSLVQFMSVISLGKVFAARHRYTVRPNRELFALGALNICGGFLRSLPVSGSFSRSAVNEQAGGRTALSNVVAATVVALTLLFLTPLFYYLPVPVLGAIIIVAAFGMIDIKELRFLLKTKRVDGLLAILTFLATIVVGIQEGVLFGITASVVAIMYRIGRPHVAILGHLPGTRSFRDFRRYVEAEPIDGILLLRVDASFSFANAEFLRDLILDKSNPPDSDIKAVIIDASSINDLDTTAAAVLASVAETLRDRRVELHFAGLKGPVQDVMELSGLASTLGTTHFFLSPHRAVMHLLEKWGKGEAYTETLPA